MAKRVDLWDLRYNEIWQFVETNHRCPSRHRINEHQLLNWMKYNRKIMNKDQMEKSKQDKFVKLLDFMHQFHNVNQYQ